MQWQRTSLRRKINLRTRPRKRQSSRSLMRSVRLRRMMRCRRLNLVNSNIIYKKKRWWLIKYEFAVFHRPSASQLSPSMKRITYIRQFWNRVLNRTVAAVDNVDAMRASIVHTPVAQQMLHVAPKAAQIGTHVRDTQCSALGRRVAPRLVVARENTQMTTSNLYSG